MHNVCKKNPFIVIELALIGYNTKDWQIQLNNWLVKQRSMA